MLDDIRTDPDRLYWEDFVQAAVEAREQRDSAQWRLGDLAAQVVTVYGQGDLQRYATAVGVEYETLKQYRTVANAFSEIGTRVPNLTWTHHREAAALDDPAPLLADAAANNWSVARLRKEMLRLSAHVPEAVAKRPRKNRGTSKPPPATPQPPPTPLAVSPTAGAPVASSPPAAPSRASAAPPAEPLQPVAVPQMLTLYTHTGEEVLYPKPQGKATFNESKGDGISWAAWSWNPVTGCLHGCDYCYAREIATSQRASAGFPVGFIPLFHSERLDAPANTRIPVKHQDDPAYWRVFVCSMADLYGQWVPDPWIQQVHDSMLASPEWEYLLLTKFPSRYTRLQLPPNAWVGTSVDEQSRVRIAEDAFRKIEGVKHKWLSLEPLRTPLKFNDLSMFDWVVIGAQTETRQPNGVVEAFSPPWQWVIEITKQALDAGCKVHWKPNLRERPGMVWPDEYPE